MTRAYTPRHACRHRGRANRKGVRRGETVIDLVCSSDMDDWRFDNWGVRCWSRTAEFEEHLRKHEKIEHDEA
ncbi:MAG: hypothetical protein J6P40_12500 [Oscillospiraceae bacterium]|nr:hypothetical protein [Oscillospiraceae bacterium]